MIADIHNKISRSGSNLSDRYEDHLTGSFFGTIRYLPFEVGLKNVLSAVQFRDASISLKWELLLSKQRKNDIQIEFWPRYEEGEIDLILYVDHAAIGIEVKYLSGLSSDDDKETLDDIDPEESINQLVRYSRLIDRLNHGDLKCLIFLAPFKTVYQIEDVMKNRPITSNVSLGYLSWENILEELKSIDFSLLPEWQVMIITDLKQFLENKGLIRFNGFRSIKNLVKPNESYRFEESPKTKWNWAMEDVDGRKTYVFKN
ncbi:hypothetical protein [Mesobacillus foraminis]|uniref:PD-(D/E)XK nuclease superfamily protein n=1 Tax=Mesobacillus foraminis TaxID=279826 RepID=A0A4R2BIR8_9BACI|nr:hypothetical protein [Mesobacillus foraminis]TCN26312.1 hypothetical protein EV146_104425 [Mesobacillus foraminis]